MSNLQEEAAVPVPEKTGTPLFRQEALRALEQRSPEASLVRISPEWVNGAFWAMLATVLSGVLVCAVGTVDEYASGPAVVTTDGRTELTARLGGSISEVLVKSGAVVSKGQVLLRLHDAQEEADAARVTGEFEATLARLLRDPTDPSARSSVSTLRRQLDQAKARMADRLIVAPTDGIVRDVRVKPGQYASPGDVMVSLSRASGGGSLIAILPGRYRPMLAPRARIRFEVDGFRYAYQILEVDSVAEEIIGPHEAQRIIGPALGDTLPITGPVVLVSARLPSPRFRVKGATYSFHEGMTGVVEVSVRREAIAYALIPGLRILRDGLQD